MTNKQLSKLLNSCKYNKIIDLCKNKKNADEMYYLALAFDQLASFNKYNKKPYNRLLQNCKKVIDLELKLFPEDTRFLFLLGLYYLHHDDSKKSLKVFTILYKKTNEPKHLISIANAQKACKKYKEALANYKKAGRSGLSKLMIAHNMAGTYILMGQTKTAKRIAKKGLLEKPKNNFEKMILDELKTILS